MMFGNQEPATWEFFDMAFNRLGYVTLRERKKRRKRRKKKEYLIFFNEAPTIFWVLLVVFYVWLQIMLTANLEEIFFFAPI